ncbi:gliding motility protein GldL [Microbacter margulisiae]|uniref:Gliding motility-associated protein GldL n=1 Tax=Microbacter margulisiae TaxID=1350067 RepID=A0A7W5H1T2_9PORP|nr:gliding motility protein GldL [Microbacter margulisiae]MBB3186934.1 gliding motility-associated protein GldL [Microbacter margulisiae]
MGLLHFIETEEGKKITAKIYGFGASVVLIGALFKIQHFPGAGWLLGIGMGTEAFLFALSGLEHPPREFDWSKVFPHFNESGHTPIESGGSGIGAHRQPITTVASNVLDEEQIKRLQTSIKNLSETAHQLTNIASAGEITTTYVQSIQSAAVATKEYAHSQQVLTEVAQNILQSYKTTEEQMGTTADQTKRFATNVSAINNHLSSINTQYELHLQAVLESNSSLSQYVSSYKLVNSNMENVQQNAAIALKATEDYVSETTKLSHRVGELNDIYGNMLSALSIKS